MPTISRPTWQSDHVLEGKLDFEFRRTSEFSTSVTTVVLAR